ncbi:MAG: preprotein translocase subunit SecG [Candidatus Melainabacteria bacterium HGW-Melainabacteria-1]|nr:MAG: preprotein translocase subunit SecG [Candidatus Melainabacteria bacterium HGW-Melainabacteria-1]
MGFFAVLLLILFVLVCALLIFLVIIQDEDSDSLGGIFAGGSASAFGSRSSNVVIKITYVLGALFFVTAFSMAIINKSSTGNVEALVSEQAGQTTNTEWWKGDTTSTTLVPGATEPAAAAPAESTTQTTTK